MFNSLLYTLLYSHKETQAGFQETHTHRENPFISIGNVFVFFTSSPYITSLKSAELGDHEAHIIPTRLFRSLLTLHAHCCCLFSLFLWLPWDVHPTSPKFIVFQWWATRRLLKWGVWTHIFWVCTLFG